MANKEFQVRHGLAVNNNVLVANTITGNVGIGTATPLAKLHVIGDAIFTGNVSFSGAAQIQSNFDSILNLNSSQANSTPALNDAGIYVNRGSLGNASIIWNEAIDRWDIRANSTNLVSVLSTGNFGIGTTAPANKLDVRGTLGVGQSSNTALNGFTLTSAIVGGDNHSATFAGPVHGTNDDVLFNLSRGGGAYGTFEVKFGGVSRLLIPGDYLRGDGYISVPATAGFAFKNNNTQNMYIDANGRVSIGQQSPSSFANGFVSLQINQSSIFSNGFNNLNLGTNIAGGVDGGGGSGIYGSNDFAAKYQQLQGTHRWDVAASGTAGNPITWTNAMILNRSGNLGIGTSSPSAKLHVVGDSIFAGNVTIVGSSQTISSNTLSIGDSLIYLAANNYAGTDVVDIGFIANYGNSTGANVHTGLYRHNATKQYYLFQGYDIEPQANNVIVPYASNMVNAVLNADLATSNLTLGGTNAISWISSAFSKANNALANTSGISFNGSLNFPSGKVGISTSSIPAANLEVNATAIAMPNSVATILSRGYDVNFAIMSSTGHAVNDPGALVGRFGLRYLTNGDDSASFNFYRGGGSLDGSIGINTNGAERMRITNAGNIGIGTTSPSANLHVIGTANVSSTIYTRDIEAPFYSLYNEGAGAYVGIKGNYLRFGGVSEFMRIANTSGYVGIGTSAPAYRLDVTPTSNEVGLHLAPTTGYDTGFYITSHANNDTVIGSGAAYVSAQFVAKASSAEIIDLYNGGYYFYGDTGLTPGSVYSPTMRMVLDSSGRLGIGTTSPSARLHVNNGNFLLNKQYVGGESQAALTVLHSNVAHQGISYDVALLQSDDAPGLRIVETNTVGNFNRTAELTLCAGDGYANNFAPASVIGSNAALIFATGREVGTPAYNSIGERVRITSAGDVMINQTSSAGTGKLGVAGRIAIDVNGSDSFSGQLYLTSLNGRPSNIQAAGPSSNGIAFWTYTGSWSERVRITGDGNVGIGTFLPNTKLEVVGNTRFTGLKGGNALLSSLLFYNSNSTGFDIAQIDALTGTNIYEGIIRFQTKDSGGTMAERMRIDASGNVGIGTSSPGTALDIFRNTGNDDTLTTLRISTYANPGDQYAVRLTSAKTATGVPYSQLMGPKDGNGWLSFTAGISDNVRMFISGAGNIGIGTTSPSAPLHVNSSIITIASTTASGKIWLREVGASATANTIELHLRPNAGKSAYLTFTEDTVDDRWSIGTQNGSGALRFISGTPSGTERMRIDASGNVGIGVTSVTAKFVSSGTARIGTLTTDYAGDVQLSADYVRIWNPSNAPAGQIRFGINQETTIRGQALVGLMFDTDGSERMRIANTGNIGIGTTSPSYRLDVNAAVANGVRFDGARPITFNSNGTGDIRIKAGAGGWSIGYLFSGSAGTDIGGFGAWGSNDSLGYHWIGSAYNTPTAVFTPGGNVAIGQTSAPERLTVFRDTDNSAAIGRAHIGYVGYPDYAGFSHVDMNSPGNYALLQGSDGKTFLNSASGQAIYFRQNNTDKMILDYLGNLGIGTNSPTSRLHIVKDFAATSPENSNKKPMRKRWVHTTQQGANGYTYTVCTISRDPLNWDEYSPVEILARNTYFQGGSYSRWIFTHGYGVNPSLVCVETGGVSGNIPNLYLGSEVTVNSNLKYTPIYCDVPYYREFNFEINHNYTEVSSITSLSQIKFDNVYTANNSAANYSGDITLVPGGGNVGIGTSSPVGKLSVAGNILAPTFNSNTSYTIGIQDAQINSFVNSKRGSLIIQSSSATSGAQAMGGGDLTLKAGNSYSSQYDTEGDVNIISGYNTLNTDFTRGKIRFITNNTERMRIDANGNIGIGVSNPASVLSVHGSNSSDGTARYTMNILNTAVPSAGVGSGLMFGTNISSASVGADNIVGMAGIEGIKENGTSGNYASALKFTTRINGGALTERLRITSNGNIGIGTSGPIEYNNTSISMTIQGPSFASINLRDAASSTRTELGAAPTESFLKSVSSLPLNFYTSNIERMRITSDGNIGIGISAPGKRVEISEDNSSTTLTTGLLISNINGTTDSRAGIVFKSYDNLGCSIWSRRTGGYAGDLCFGTKPNSSGSISEVGITERMRINGDGNVGIGTASPGLYTGHTTLAINNATYGGLIDLLTNGTRHLTLYSGTAASIIGTVSSTALTFLSHNTERMRIDSAGNVGIGTSAPQTRLHVGTKITDDAGYTYDSNTFMAIHQSPTGTSRLNDPKTVMMLARQGWGGEAYGAAVAFDLSRYENSGVFSRTRLDITLANNNFIAQNTTVMTLLSSGNVGIGTTAPSAKLQISNAGSFTAIRATNTTDSVQFDAIAGSTAVAIGAATSHPLVFNAGNTERMRLDTNGNLGIGTTTPLYSYTRLHLARTGYAQQVLENTTDSIRGEVTVYDTTLPMQVGTITSHDLILSTAAVRRMTITAAGNVGVGTSTPAYKLQVNGSFAANTKSFVIDHPTKPGMKLRHGSLEGPENGVYVRGKTKEKVIELPEYWRGLVDSSTITVQLTAIGRSQNLYVVDVSDNRVYIDSENYTDVDCYYYIQAERKDVEKLVVEY